jgi:uncharacterized membrane-anchored protein YhcB (DUF1043 family)
MTDETGAAAPTTEQAQPAPAASEQATPATSIPTVEAEPENAETKANETEQAPEGEDTEPKRLTRNQRLQRKAARLSTMVAEQAAELERLRQASSKADAESEPKEADFNGDWTKYQAEYAAWKAAQTVERKFTEREQRETAARLNERKQEASDEFQERAEQLKTSIPDFDKTVEAFATAGGKFAPHVIEELLESDKGPLLAYQLAKNPSLAAELNALSPRDAAREIGRLEAKTALPQPKKQTQAPSPLNPVKGGASPAKSEAELAKSEDVSELISMWRKKKSA